jgi:hypothetical protein
VSGMTNSAFYLGGGLGPVLGGSAGTASRLLLELLGAVDTLAVLFTSDLSYEMSFDDHFFLHFSFSLLWILCQTDGQTDRQTDGQTSLSLD